MIPQQSKKTQHFYPLSRWLSQQISLGQMMHTKSKPPRYTSTQIVTILIVLLSILLFTIPSNATPLPTLELYLFDAEAPSWEPLNEPIFYEDHTYDIAVTQQDNVTFAYDVTLTIGTLDETYKTSTVMPYITITAPTYDSTNNDLIITATKEGYETTILSVTILKGSLTITTDRETVPEGESFSVIVKNSEGQYICDCLIYQDSVSSQSCTAMTNKQGIAYLPAPNVKEDTYLTIIAVKDGYAATTSIIRIEDVHTTFIGEVSPELSDILPMIFAVLSVIAAIIIVTFRNHHDQYMPEVKIHQTHTHPPSQPHQHTQNHTQIKNQQIHSKPAYPPVSSLPPKKAQPPISQSLTNPLVRNTECRNPHIEEIRIHVQKNQKTSKKLSAEDKIDRLIPRHKTQGYEWFNGKDDIRYKIDSLTGEIDEQKADKWFEGIEEIRCKVDEKLKKKTHKKNDNT